MSSGNVANYLKAKVGPEAAFQYDDDPTSSQFTKSGYYTTTPHLEARYVIQPQTRLNDYGNQRAVFKVEKDHDFAGLADIQIPTQGVTGTTGTSNFARRADWFAFAVVKEVQVKHNTHLLQGFLGDVALPHYLLEATKETRALMDPMIGGNLSAAQRSRMVTVDQVYRYPLDLFVWWCKNTHTYMNTQSYTDEIQIHVYFNHQSEWLQTDAPNPSAILGPVTIRSQVYDMGLVLQMHYVVESERIYHHNMILNEGTLEPFVDYINVGTDTIPANQDNFFDIELKNLNMPVRHICFHVSRASDRTTNYNKNYTKWLDIVGFGMYTTTSGGEFVTFKPDKYNRTRVHDQYHSGMVDDRYPLYFVTWTPVPEDHINELGSFNFGNVNNPKLRIYIGTGVHDSEARDVSNGNHPGQVAGEQLVVSTFAQAFNMKQEFGGTPKRTYA